MARGGSREGAGRKAGIPNKKTLEQIEAVEEGGITPLDYLLEVIREPIPEEADATAKAQMRANRMDAAKAAAPYVHPKLSSTEVTGPGENGELTLDFTVKYISADNSGTPGKT